MLLVEGMGVGDSATIALAAVLLDSNTAYLLLNKRKVSKLSARLPTITWPQVFW